MATTPATYAANTPLHTEPTDPKACCLPPLCSIDPCDLVCNFVNLLPSGPLWDRAKQKVIWRFRNPDPDCVNDVYQVNCLYEERLCISVAQHSVYTALRLYDILLNALWPALRESDPWTAFDTMDDWLERMKWKDCMTSCRDPELGPMTPIEIMTTCGPQVCDIDYPQCLIDTVKHGIIIALYKLRLGRVWTLDNVNYLLEHLYVRLVPVNAGNEICPVEFDLCPIADEIPTWVRDNCLPRGETCQAWVDPNGCFGRGLPEKVYPGLLAAECIVRSVLPRCGSIKINRKCEVCET